jgi:hypothetical protein
MFLTIRLRPSLSLQLRKWLGLLHVLLPCRQLINQDLAYCQPSVIEISKVGILTEWLSSSLAPP